MNGEADVDFDDWRPASDGELERLFGIEDHEELEDEPAEEEPFGLDFDQEVQDG